MILIDPCRPLLVRVDRARQAAQAALTRVFVQSDEAFLLRPEMFIERTLGYTCGRRDVGDRGICIPLGGHATSHPFQKAGAMVQR